MLTIFSSDRAALLRRREAFSLLLSAFSCSAFVSAQAQNWTLTSAPTNNWSAIAGSSDLTVLAATVDGGGIYYSTNSGTNWLAANAPSNSWTSIAFALDGAKMVAVALTGGIWVSADFGSTWDRSPGPGNDLTAVASSADGSRLVAVVAGGGIWTSTNSGIAWILTSAPTNASPHNYWSSVASSWDGMRLAAVQTGGYLYASKDGGNSWSSSGPGGVWQYVASSTNGSVVVGDTCCEGSIYVSTNGADGWEEAGLRGYWGSITISADGSKLIALQGSSPIFASADSGATWSPFDAPSEDWQSALLSADGDRVAAATSAGGIYTWQATVPVIASQPQTAIILGGLAPALSVGAFATEPIFYQWQSNGTNIQGATNATLTLPNINVSSAGTYTVIVSNSYGATFSSNAVLTVVPAFISTLSANYGISDAILTGSVSTGSNNTVVWFNWGADTNYGNSTPAHPVGDAVASLNFSNRITGLMPYTTFHYQAVASNTIGVVYGADSSFTTAPRFVPITGGNGNWTGFAWSTNGGRMFASASNNLYLSTDFGASWTPISDRGLQIYIPSADGTKLVGLSGTNLYLTTNSGATWSTNHTPIAFGDFAASADLNKLAAIGGGQIYVSANTGATWTLTTASSGNWISIASSADGNDLVTLYPQGDLNGEYAIVARSTNAGANWSYFDAAVGETYIAGIACSANGATLVIPGETSFISTDLGATWHAIPIGLFGQVGPFDAIAAACSADGTTVIITATDSGDEGIYITPNSGGQWFRANAPVSGAVFISSAGTKFAALINGYIYISESNPQPVLNVVSLSSTNILLTWMQPTTNFILQQSSDLANRSTITTPPTLNITNLQEQLLLPLSQSASFYRLKIR